MNESLIKEQSEAAYKQWCEQWRRQAKYNSKHEMKSLLDFENIGVGRAVVCVANGYSLEENIHILKEHQENVDILCCDKTLGTLIDNGIIPDFCMVCDANVNYEKYMKPWELKLQGTILFSNVCGSTEWAENGNWKAKYFFVNKDVLHSELEFCELSGCKNTIPAGTNVSNAMVVLLTQSDDKGSRNYFGYDKILLLGYDYSWKINGKYYAFNEDGDGKAKYMRHIVGNNRGGDVCVTSGNLHFSAQWLDQYIRVYKLPIVQLSSNTVLGVPPIAEITSQLKYSYRPEDSSTIKGSVQRLREIIAEKVKLEQSIGVIAKSHWDNHVSTLF